jgi:hypothetical protein
MTYLSVDELTAPDLEEADVELPGGGMVRVRALSRAEVLRIRKEAGDDAAKIERLSLVAGMLQPQMSVDEVARWQRNSNVNGPIGVVQQRIQELSGINEGAGKSGLVRDGANGAGARALPSSEDGPDGGGVTGDAESG